MTRKRGNNPSPASPRICRYRVIKGMRQNLLRGGILMDANYMEKGNAPRLSPRSGLKCAKGCAMNFDKIVKNPVNIDKFTMYFDNKTPGKIL